jgi:hypothetical protein
MSPVYTPVSVPAGGPHRLECYGSLGPPDTVDCRYDCVPGKAVIYWTRVTRLQSGESVKTKRRIQVLIEVKRTGDIT